MLGLITLTQTSNSSTQHSSIKIMYMKEKYELPEGFVDLSEEVKPLAIFSASEPEEDEEEEDEVEYSYPSLYFNNDEGLKEGNMLIIVFICSLYIRLLFLFHKYRDFFLIKKIFFNLF